LALTDQMSQIFYFSLNNCNLFFCNTKSLASYEIYKTNGCDNHFPFTIPSLLNLSSLLYFLSCSSFPCPLSSSVSNSKPSFKMVPSYGSLRYDKERMSFF
jgi:hypothetical protein